MSRLRERLGALNRFTPAAKGGVDWVGRWEDIKTVGKWVWGGIKWLAVLATMVWRWIVANSLADALLAGAVVLVALSLFGPSIQDEFRERRLAKKWKRKRLAGWGDILPDMERLAESLEAERLDEKGERIALLNGNRIALAEIARALVARNILHPDPSPPHRKTEEWETFLWGFIHRVKAGDADTLPTLYEDMQKAFERREYWRDGANLVRHYLQQMKDEESENS